MKETMLKDIIRAYVFVVYDVRYGYYVLDKVSEPVIKNKYFDDINNFIDEHYYDYLIENYGTKNIIEALGIDPDDYDAVFEAEFSDEYNELWNKNDDYALEKTIDFAVNQFMGEE